MLKAKAVVSSLPPPTTRSCGGSLPSGDWVFLKIGQNDLFIGCNKDKMGWGNVHAFGKDNMLERWLTSNIFWGPTWDGDKMHVPGSGKDSVMRPSHLGSKWTSYVNLRDPEVKALCVCLIAPHIPSWAITSPFSFEAHWAWVILCPTVKAPPSLSTLRQFLSMCTSLHYHRENNSFGIGLEMFEYSLLLIIFWLVVNCLPSKPLFTFLEWEW